MDILATFMEYYRGSVSAKMGEVALSNLGVLFLDELPHFSKSVLEALREPLEDNKLSLQYGSARSASFHPLQTVS